MTISTIFDSIRTACSQLSTVSQYVHLNEDKLAEYAASLKQEESFQPTYDTIHHFMGDAPAVVAYILCLDSINFGSGYFPYINKRPNMSGYFTMASCLKDRFDAQGVWSAKELIQLKVKDCHDIFEQSGEHPLQIELMQHFTYALRDLGSLLADSFDGSYTKLLKSANNSAEALVDILKHMPYYQDVSAYPLENNRTLVVPLYKRAQITVSDLALAFNYKDNGYFEDLAALTIFADNLVPHVLYCDGILSYDESLIEMIESEIPIEAQSKQEIELRGVALHAVERIVEELKKLPDMPNLTSQQVDVTLWDRGQHPDYKSRKRHRTRSVFY